MTQVRVLTDLAQWFYQFAFIAAAVFTVIYAAFFDWRCTVTGRALLTFGAAVMAATLHSVLVLWGMPNYVTASASGITLGPWWSVSLDWLSVVGLGAAGLALTAMAWQALRYRFMESKNPLVGKLLLLGYKERMSPWSGGPRG